MSAALSACQALADRMLACQAALADDAVDVEYLTGELAGLAAAIAALPTAADGEEAEHCVTILRRVDDERRRCLQRCEELRRMRSEDAERDAGAARGARAYRGGDAQDARFVDHRQ